MPVMLGGAALTRSYVEEDCVEAYACGRVAYARDAFDGLRLMDKVTGNAFDDYLAAVQREATSGKRATPRARLGQAADARPFRPVDVDGNPPAPRRADARRAGARAAVLGRARDRGVPAKAIVPFSTSAGSTSSSGASASRAARWTISKAWAKRELRPVMRRMLADVRQAGHPAAAGGLWLLALRRGQGNDLILFDDGRPARRWRASRFPRQTKEDGECIADFFRDIDDAERDVIGCRW